MRLRSAFRNEYRSASGGVRIRAGLIAEGVKGDILADSSVVIAWDGSNGFGTDGPTIAIFDDFRGGAEDDQIPLTGPIIGAWTTVDEPPTHQTTYTLETPRSGDACMRSRNFPKYSSEALPVFGVLKLNFTDSSTIFVSYCIRVPQFWPGGGPSGGAEDTFYTGSNFKLNWLSHDQGQAVDGDTDIVLPSKTGTVSSPPNPIFQIAGNDGNIAYDLDVSGRISPNPADAWGPAGDWWAWDGWQRMSFWLRAGADADFDDGDLWAQVVSPNAGANKAISSSGEPVFNGSSSETVNWMQFPGWMRDVDPNESDDDCRPLYDDIYFAYGAGAAARVEIGNHATYDKCTDLAIATPTSWSNTSITCNLRSGAFPSFSGKYIHIHDKDNALVGTSRGIG